MRKAFCSSTESTLEAIDRTYSLQSADDLSDLFCLESKAMISSWKV